jgi:hypothetical protein
MAAALELYQAYFGPLVRFGLTALALLFLWVGLRRAGLTRKARMTGIVTTGLLLTWWLAMDALGRAGFFAPNWSVMRPLCWAIAIAWLVPLTRSESIGAALDATSSACSSIAPGAASFGSQRGRQGACRPRSP